VRHARRDKLVGQAEPRPPWGIEDMTERLNLHIVHNGWEALRDVKWLWNNELESETAVWEKM
jgi:hypothetical protein